MLNKKKGKHRRQQEAAADKRFRYSIRKFNVGVASVAIAAFMFLGGGAVVSADDTAVSEPQTVASSTGDSSSATSEAQTATSTEATSTASEASTSTEATAATSESAAASTEATSTVSEASTSTEATAATSESAVASTEATSTASEASTSTEATAATSESAATSTTASTASSEATSNTASTPTTVEEAKTVLEQVISEAEVLAQEASREAASSTEDASALQTAAQATKVVVTEATATFNDSLATLEEVNAQISAIRTNVEALVLELRKYSPNGEIMAMLASASASSSATVTDMPNSVGNPGYWIEDKTVTNKEDAVKVASTTETVSEIPAGYEADPTDGRTTYLIFTLSNAQVDDTLTDGTANGSFNNRMGTDYYITLSVDRINTTGNVYARLVSQSKGLVEEISISVGSTGRFTTLDDLVKNNATLLKGFNFRIPLTETTYTNAAGESSTLRETQILQGTKGNAQGQVVYGMLTSDRGYYNDYSGPAPTYSPRQTTFYLVKETDTRVEEFLASYTQFADLSGDTFSIASPATFDNYELIESPVIEKGTIASDYTKGTSIIRFWGDYLESKVQYITDSDGSSRFLNFVINPDNADFLANYAKYKTMSQVDFQADGETVLRINERMAIVNQLETDIATVNKSTTLTDDEKKAKIAELRATASAAVNTADDAFLLMFVSEEIAPKGYNENGDAITTEHSWKYTSTNYYFKDTKTNTISNTMGAATGAFSGQPNANWINSNGSYLQVVDADGNVITNTTTNTDMKFKNINLSMFNSNSLNQNDQRYYYAEKGGVKVYYVDTEGNVLQSDVTIYDHEATNTAYDTKSVKDATITTADGTVYYYKEIDTTGLNPASSNTDTEKRTIEKITEEVGTVAQDTLKELTYVYEKAGNVNVNYVDTDGNPLQAPVADVTDGKPGSDYATTDHKPAEITTADGKTYQLVPAGTYNVGTVSDAGNLTAVANGTATGVDSETGTVEAGKTKEITYVYKEVKGDVIVHYVDTEGNPISGTTDEGKKTASTVTDTPESSTGTPYNTTDLKPKTITTDDGKIYKLVPAATKGEEDGKVVVGTTEITYVYELVQGDVIVHYVDTEGNTIADDVTDQTITDTGTDYDTRDNKPEKITNDQTGEVYYILPKDEVKAGDKETGKVVEGTTEVTYIYEKAGSVNVNYVDTEGNVLKAPVADVTDGKPGSDYDTVLDNKLASISVDGKLYRLVPAGTYNVGTVSNDNNLTAVGNGKATGIDATTGTVEAGKTKEITYVYEEVKGDVVVEYYDTEGNTIAKTEVDTPTTSVDTPYETYDHKPATITVVEKDGSETLYYYKEVKDTSAPEKGDVVEGTTTVQYVYEKAGNVNVNYVDTEGNVIQAPVADVTDGKPDSAYATTDHKPEEITTADGKTYRLVAKEKAGDYPVGTVSDEGNLTAVGNGTATGVDSETGTVEAGKTKEITYVYEEVKGDVIVHYVDTEGNPISGTTDEGKQTASTVTDTPESSTGTPYDTTDLKPKEITTDEGKTYRIVPTLTKGNETGDVVEGTTEITYVYEEVKGDVVVNYVNTDGDVIAPQVVDTKTTSTGVDYDTTDHKPSKITTESGEVYYYKEVKAGDNETGKVVEGTTEVTYIYEKAGSVNVNYVDTDGNPIQAPVADETNEKAGTEYATADNKPTTITTADGKTYKLVPAGTYNVGTVSDDNNLTSVGNGTATGVDSTTGTVEAGTTKEITYVYEEVKGNVVVNYITTDGTVIKQPVEDTPSTSTGTPYDTTDNKPTTITTEDGKTYRIVPTLTKGNETGDVVEGTTSITYVYEEVKGDVVVEYYDTEGNLISGISDSGEAVDSTEVDTPSTSTGTAYNTDEDHKPNTITTADGTVYYYKEVKDTSASTTGEVVEGTTTVQYVYEKAGSVNVNYVDTEGNVIQAPVADETNEKAGTEYATADNKPTTITTADGKVYKLVPAGTYNVGTVSDDNNLTAAGNGTATGVDSVTGTVEAGTTKEITYVYEEVKGNVVVEYYDTDGNVIATTVVDTPDSSVGTPYNTLDQKPATITTADGTVYYYKEVKSTSAAEDGTVVEGTTTVQYVYEKAGSVNVNYVDTDGNPIQAPVADETNEKAGTEYTTADNKPTTITTADGKTYKLVPAGTYNVGTVSDDNNLTSVGNGTATGVDSTTGTVEAGTTKEITYVYEEVKGNVVVNYITTDGTVIKQPVEDTPSTSTGTPYDTTDNKPTTITTEDGKTYRIVPTLTQGNETGDVVEGTTSITYVYEEVKGDVVVEYYDTEGNLISGLSDSGEAVDTKEVDTPSTSTGTAYNTDEDHKPNTITTADGTVYYYKEVKDTSASTTGEVVEGTTTVQYVYEKAGNVIVHYITEDGTVIKATVTDEENAEPGKSYTTTDNKPTTITTEDGTVYELIPTATIGNEDGSVEAGKTIEVTYVYRKVETPTPAAKEGNVVVNYITTDGTVIKQPVEDTPSTSTGTPYDTTDNKPTTITTEDGKTYRIVPTLTQGKETGDVVEGTTSITYVYEEVKGDVVVEYYDTEGNLISGLSDSGEAVDTKEVDTPSTSTGTAYNTDEDHKPNTITTADGTVYYYKEVKDTSASTTGEVVEGTTTVQYVYEKAGNVIVHYITEDGTVIKATVTDEENAEPGKSYTTTDNKPTTITTEDGTVYELIPTATIGNEDGSVEAGKTIEVTYVYRKVETPKSVVTNHVDEEGNVISPQEDGTTPNKGTSIPGYEFTGKTITDENGNTTHIYRKVETPKSVVTNHVDEEGNVISPQEDGTTPNKGTSIPGYEFTGKTITDENGNTTHIYRKVETPKSVVTNHVDEEGNVISPQEDGTTPNKGTSIPGYEFTGKTITDENGNTTHIYRKVVTPVDTKAPVQPGVPVKPETLAKPGVPTKPEASAKPTYVAETLPNTGEDNSASVAAMGAGMILASLGLAAKRRRKED